MSTLDNLNIIESARPLDCSNSNDLDTRRRINRSLLRIIRSHARLVGDAWAIGMHEEASRVDVAATAERSKDLAWLWREQQRAREPGLWLDATA